MAIGNIQSYDCAVPKDTGSLPYKVTANSVGSNGAVSRILPGEPVTKIAGAAGVLAGADNCPTTTLRIVGIAASTSTETASVDGIVQVIPATNGQFWKVLAQTSTDIDTQAKYNALVGARCLLDNTAGVYSMILSDGASNGCIVEYSDIAKNPGYVVFSFSPLCDYRNV
jgi:hypothetical protein